MVATPENSKKKKFIISWQMLAIGLGVFIILLIAIVWYRHSRLYVWTNDAYIDGYQISISPDIEGARIIDLYVDEGDIVTKGQLLCQLDESVYESKKADASTGVIQAEKSAAFYKIELEKLRDIYTVALNEYEKEIISYIDFDKIEKDYLAAEAQYNVSEANLTNSTAKLGVIDEILRHTKIYAPRNGAISKRWVVAGDVPAITQPLFMLTDIENIYVTALLEETKVGHLKQGDHVDIHVDAYPDRKFTGKVFAVRASAASQFALIPPDNATGNFTKVVQRVPVKILLDVPKTNHPLYLYPGMSVEISVKVR